MLFKTDSNKISKGQLNKMLKVSSRLKRLSSDKVSGWGDFCILLENYVTSMLEHKKNFNLTMASDEQIQMLKLHDRDIWLINNFIKKIPYQFIENLEQEVRKRREEAELPPEEQI